MKMEARDAASDSLIAGGEVKHFREPGTPAGHMIRLHSDGARELVRVEEDGSMYVVRPL